MQQIQASNGDAGLILYLKVASISLQQAASDYRLNDVTQFGMRCSRTKSGKLPRLIPSYHRIIIRNNSPGSYILIKFYLTMFYLYRIIPIKNYKSSFKTIIEPGKVFDMKIFTPYIERFIKLFVYEQYRLIPTFYMKRFFKIFSISRSSPNNFGLTLEDSSGKSLPRSSRGPFWSTHPLVMMRSAMAITSNFETLVPFTELAEHYAPKLKFMIKQLGFPKISYAKALGKLAFKEEAAGKLRVFAIVDCFTQWLLYPLHKLLFSILKRVPMDGTFNQVRPVYRLLRRKPKSLHSLDLTAATDRLPISIQILLLNELIQEIPSFGNKWAALLVNRNYRYFDPYSMSSGSVRYSVGQPMGALSSWAMLALTHHFIVQVAAWRIGYPKHLLFKEYAVLGDDIVIGRRNVAESYLLLMDKIGVGISLHKSVISYNGRGLEFAKRTIIDGIDCSPISLKDLSISLQPGNVSSWVAFANTHSMSFDLQRKVLGFGFRTCVNSFARMCHALQVVYLANIAKADFNTQVLSLRSKVPVDFDSILPLFKANVLSPAIKSIMSDLNNLTRLRSDAVYVMKNMDATYREYFKTFSASVGLTEKDILSRIDMAEAQVGHSDHLKVHEDLTKAFKGIYDLNKIKTMDEALQAYFTLIRDRATVNIALLKLENVSNKASSKLPFQARLFRNWSRISHSMIKQLKLNKLA